MKNKNYINVCDYSSNNKELSKYWQNVFLKATPQNFELICCCKIKENGTFRFFEIFSNPQSNILAINELYSIDYNSSHFLGKFSKHLSLEYKTFQNINSHFRGEHRRAHIFIMHIESMFRDTNAPKFEGIRLKEYGIILSEKILSQDNKVNFNSYRIYNKVDTQLYKSATKPETENPFDSLLNFHNSSLAELEEKEKINILKYTINTNNQIYLASLNLTITL